MKRDLPAFVYAKGPKRLLYFVRAGVCERIHDRPGTPQFASTYARLMQGRTVTPQKTVRKLIRAYTASKGWQALAANTRKSYARHFAYFEDAMGDIDPATLRPVHIQQMHEALSNKPTDANRKVSALASLLQYGVTHDWLPSNPARQIRLSNAHVKPHAVWPENVIEAYRSTATGPALLLFEILISTGQRIGDVLAMQWAHIDGDGINVRQSKTGTAIWVPLTGRLRVALAEAPRRGLFIVSQENGKPMGYQMAWRLIADVRKTIDAMEYDIHGLRHTAASEIAGAPGMTTDHVRAITGHKSDGMARHYSLKAGQRARAEEAQKGRK